MLMVARLGFLCRANGASFADPSQTFRRPTEKDLVTGLFAPCRSPPSCHACTRGEKRCDQGNNSAIIMLFLLAHCLMGRKRGPGLLARYSFELRMRPAIGWQDVNVSDSLAIPGYPCGNPKLMISSVYFYTRAASSTCWRCRSHAPADDKLSMRAPRSRRIHEDLRTSGNEA